MFTNTNRKEAGFTLFELLTVIVIIGIVAAIAIPGYRNQKARAYDAATKADQRSAVVKVETLLMTGSNVATLALSDLPEEGVQQTVGGWHMYAPTGPNSYIICSWNERGKEYRGDNGKGVWVFNSLTRVPVKQSSCFETAVG